MLLHQQVVHLHKICKVMKLCNTDNEHCPNMSVVDGVENHDKYGPVQSVQGRSVLATKYA